MVVAPSGSKQWEFRYRLNGRRRKIAIKGGYPKVGVGVARETASTFRNMVARGEDPLEVRKTSREEKVHQKEEEKAAQVRNETTFAKVAHQWFEKLALPNLVPSNAATTWRRLEKNVFPWIGSPPMVSRLLKSRAGVVWDEF